MARTRAQDYDAKRAAILHDAAELFAQHGYSATSITMISKACGTSKALLYHYYQDKAAVLFDLLFTHLQELLAAVETTALQKCDAKERVYRLAATLLELYRDANAEHQVQIANLKHLAQEKQEILVSMERRLVAIFSDAIAEAAPAVGRGPLLKPLTMSMFGMLNWHYLWFREGKGLTRSQYARLVTELVLAGAGRTVSAIALAGPAKSNRTAATRRTVKVT